MREPVTSGVLCATLTPVGRDGSPCLPLLIDHCRWLLDSGCSGIVLLGTTGEANSFTVAERRHVLEGVVGGGIPAHALVVGTGCCAVGDTKVLTKHALATGCSRVLMLPPFYYKSVLDEGIVAAYSDSIEAVGDDRLRVYLYRIPQMSGVDVGEVVIEALIARYGSAIAGIKDSSGDLKALEGLCARFSSEIDVLAGSERHLLNALKAGAAGCVSATANATAPLVCDVYAGRSDPQARTRQEQATAARDVFEKFPLIPALKTVLAGRTGDARWESVRPPLSKLSAAQSAAMFEGLKAFL
jgi:4-hydroxy-tetrahydrodipicolinate synthase